MNESSPQLPFDFHRTSTTKTRWGGHRFSLTLPAGAAVPDASLAAAFGVLLFRYAARTSIILNASRFGAAGEVRWRRPLVLSTASGTACREVLRQAQEFIRRLDGGENGRGAPDRGSSGGGAAIVLLDPRRARDLGGDPQAQPFVRDSTFEDAPDDLHLAVAHSDDGTEAAFFYNSNLFRRSSIERFARHLQVVLTHLAVPTEALISRLPLLPPAERLWIESVCDGRPREAPAELVHRSFERQAAASPETTALRFRDGSLTYRQLNVKANALARSLKARGVDAESRVAVCLEPSFDIAIALLAILKAGGVYVPLDPAHPAARMRASLDDIRPSLVVTRENLRERFAFEGNATLTMDDFERLTNGHSGENLDLPIQAEQTAYIYYTSGTTGAPKGAAASQANLASYIRAARDRYGIGAPDVMPAIARYSFSISMFELMSPLAAGGTLVILEREHVLDPGRLSRTLEEATIFHAGPALLKNLVAHIKRRYPDFASFSRVRHASSGGDMVPPELLEALKLIFANADVFVIYGCSEISCMGCTYPIPRDRTVERTYVGRPFDNMAVRVLDPALNLLPPGIVGEIHFAGDGVVDGYLNLPEQTAEKFVDIDGRRFYRTGDMGRLSEDGWLEILGRIDFQVKLRGMRVELGEVEHHLRRAAGVLDGVVMPKRLAGDEKALVAYVVMDPGERPADGAESPIAAVQRHMRENVPDYMVPAAYVELESLPLNHNMKVDRHALPDPQAQSSRIGAASRFRAPASSTERRLAALWMKLLGLDSVGLDDYFFDVGGQSVLGITLILDVESELGVVLTGMEVLRESLEGQAAICDQRLDRASSPACASRPAGPPAPDEDLEIFHFGEGRGLYGALNGASAAADEAVLICPSVGQEHLRAHFILHRLARRLEDRGVPALRFDYYGCGDSMGESFAATCGRWRHDIEEAYHELRRRTGATRITAVAVRLGAALLGKAADDLDFARLVVWDPVCDGSAYLAEIAEAHAAYVGGWRRLLGAPRRAGDEIELLGLVCSETNAREMKALGFAPSEFRRRPPIKWLAATRADLQSDLFRRFAGDRKESRMETIDFDCGWSDIGRLSHLLPDAGISSMLAALATERS